MTARYINVVSKKMHFGRAISCLESRPTRVRSPHHARCRSPHRVLCRSRRAGDLRTTRQWRCSRVSMRRTWLRGGWSSISWIELIQGRARPALVLHSTAECDGSLQLAGESDDIYPILRAERGCNQNLCYSASRDCQSGWARVFHGSDNGSERERVSSDTTRALSSYFTDVVLRYLQGIRRPRSSEDFASYQCSVRTRPTSRLFVTVSSTCVTRVRIMRFTFGFIILTVVLFRATEALPALDIVSGENAYLFKFSVEPTDETSLQRQASSTKNRLASNPVVSESNS